MGRPKAESVGKTRGKLEAVQQKQAKAARNRRVNFIIGGTVLVVAASLIAFAINSKSGTTTSKSTAISGVQTFTGLATKHVKGPVKYSQTPPVGGEHSAVWLNCAIYSEPVPNENAVHSLEHSAVWVTYDPTVITGDQLTALRKLIPKTYAILSPYPGLPAPIVASAWGAQLTASKADDPRIAEFIAKYRESKSAPEPGATCTGGLDGPGKIS